MSIKPSDIWQNNPDFPSLETIHKYLDGKMDSGEQHHFEKLMADSELLSDAVEGLQLERQTNVGAIDEIHHLIDQQEDSENTKVVPLINYRNLAIASSFALLITAGGVIFINWIKNKSSSEPVAVQTLTKGDTLNNLSQSDSILKSPPNNNQSGQAVALLDTKENTLAKPLGTPLKDKDLVQSSVANGPGNSAAISQGASGMGHQSLKPQDVVNQTADQNTIDSNVNLPTLAMERNMEEEQNELEKESKSDQAAPMSKSSVSSAPSIQFKKERSKKMESSKSKDAPTLGLDFLGSINRLIEKNKFQQASQELDLVIEFNDHRKEEALWLKSVCLIKLKKNAEAKVVLNQIVLIDRNYKSQALRVLNNLK